MKERGNRYDDSEFITALQKIDPAGTSEIAEVVGCTRIAAYHRLNDFHDNGRVTKEKIGGSLIWRLADSET